MTETVNHPASGKMSDPEQPALPEQGVPGGWRDPWEEDPLEAARAQVEETKRRVREERRRVRLEREADRRTECRSA